MSERIEPIVKRITVPDGPAEVFGLFATRLGEWWPLSGFSVAGDDATDARVEPRAGGRVYEVTRSGGEHDWGLVVEWQQDRRIGVDWHPGSSASEATRVEISFLSMGGQTEVTLVHDGWGSTGESARERRDRYDDGWDAVLSRVPGATPVPVPASS